MSDEAKMPDPKVEAAKLISFLRSDFPEVEESAEPGDQEDFRNSVPPMVRSLMARTVRALGQVYVVESGEYEQRGVNFVAASPEDAVRRLKGTYQSPYIVKWHELERRRGGAWGISADFALVVGYSTRHPADWDITPYPIDGLERMAAEIEKGKP